MNDVGLVSLRLTSKKSTQQFSVPNTTLTWRLPAGNEWIKPLCYEILALKVFFNENLVRSCLSKIENCLEVLAYVFHLKSNQQSILISFLFYTFIGLVIKCLNKTLFMRIVSHNFLVKVLDSLARTGRIFC